MKITFDGDNGTVVPDNKVLELASSIIEKGEDTTIGSDLLVDAIRVIMVRKNIDPTSIVFCFREKEIPVNDSYHLKKYPDGFCDQHSLLLRELISSRIVGNHT